MKTIKYLSIRVLAITALALVFAMPAKAQLTDNGYANIDWQFNFPLSNHFADKASGWGMSFEGGYYVTPNIALGAFLAYHSNHVNLERSTPVTLTGKVIPLKVVASILTNSTLCSSCLSALPDVILSTAVALSNLTLD